MLQLNYLSSQNADYIETLLERYLHDPNDVDDSWRYFFDGFHLSQTVEPTPVRGVAPPSALTSDQIELEFKVAALIETYRNHGHIASDINPLEPRASEIPEELSLRYFGLKDEHLKRSFEAGRLLSKSQALTLEEILARLKKVYCGKIGIEYSHVHDEKARQWLQAKVEGATRPSFSFEPVTILEQLTQTEVFEQYLHTRFVAQKRFSIEGADVLIPMLHQLIEQSAALGGEDIVMGMAHRGRLNVLTHIFRKKYEYLLTEFEGNYQADTSVSEGDVKYHMGYSYDHKTKEGKVVHLSLANNPSHLEFVNPVVNGIARAKIDQKAKASAKNVQDVLEKVLAITIHGDAAFAGQGIVYETIQMSALRGYKVGGTIRIILNNQVGFTTRPSDARSTRYASDVAKMLDVPIFHCNGDDVESAIQVVQWALEYRQAFQRDVVIDLVCYRKYGHNEGDEPSFTQPLMYQKIKTHASPRAKYAEALQNRNALTVAQAEGLVEKIQNQLIQLHEQIKAKGNKGAVSVFEGMWKNLRRPHEKDFFSPVPSTRVSLETLKTLGVKLCVTPPAFHPHPKLVRLLSERRQMIEKGHGLDWGTVETLAYATLLNEGNPVRLSGQDVERGTFSHRHSVLYDVENNKTYIPLNHLSATQAQYFVVNSLLSESAVLGFEYGYSIADPHTLTIWEAQFGDFMNGAQVIIDQFIATSESKWERMSGLVLLLPHGYEGQGPEHSSARLERFLQLCGRDNIQVMNLTTPAQLFHALRRQMKREFRKPLVIMSPKKLLRLPEAVSSLQDLANGGFQEVLDDPRASPKVQHLLLCCGKIYYELVMEREKQKADHVAIVRLEQLYPWPQEKIAEVLKKYKNAKRMTWVQEEPRNMGAWSFVREFIPSMEYVGRAVAAAPAVGSPKAHQKEQERIIKTALEK